jgi:hypothetical protein
MNLSCCYALAEGTLQCDFYFSGISSLAMTRRKYVKQKGEYTKGNKKNCSTLTTSQIGRSYRMIQIEDAQNK